MTRPDLGSGRDAALAAPNSRFNSDRSLTIVREEDEERMAMNENEEGLLAPSGAYGAEDEEADRVFALVDAKLEERGARRRAKAEAMAALKRQHPLQTGEDGSASAVFTDLKKDLSRVSMEEWAALPEAGDFRTKRVKKSSDKERYTPLPDSIVLGAGREEGYGTEAAEAEAELDTADFARIKDARERVLGIRIDQALAAETPSTEQAVDAQEYLAQMNSQAAARSQIGDVKRARLMLQSAVQTNPSSAQAWIGLLRLEEADLELKRARELAIKACEACPEAEDVWLEALRLLPRPQALELMGRALESMPRSARLWIAAAGLEEEGRRKQRLLQRGLEQAPDSSLLWRALVELEEDEAEAGALLTTAVEHCPEDIQLWLALARLQDHEGARKTLNRALQANKSSKTVWLAAARLEEAYERVEMVERIVQRAVTDLQLGAQEWFDAAVECEQTGDIHTAAALIKATMADFDPVSQADIAMERGAPHVASALLNAALQLNNSPSVWLKLIESATTSAVGQVWEAAVSACPQSEELWMGLVQYQMQHGDQSAVDGALDRAYTQLPGSEAIWLTAAKLQLARKSPAEARRLLGLARERGLVAEQLWILSARLASTPEEAKALLIQGIDKLPACGELWIKLAEMEAGSPAIARGIFEKALEHSPHCAELWIAAAALEEAGKDSASIARARVVLEKGRQKIISCELLWLHSVRLEVRAGQPVMAKTLLAKALQSCPRSGILWSEAVWMEPRPLRRGKANTAAMQTGGQEPYVLLTQAKLLWADRKLEPARDLFEKAIMADPKNADVWAYYVLFAQTHLQPGDDERLIKTAFGRGLLTNGIQWLEFTRRQAQLTDEASKELFIQFISTLSAPL